MFPGEIGDIGFAPRALEHYATALEATVDVERIRAAEFKIVIDYAYGSTSFAMPNVLAKLGPRGAGRQPVRLDRRGHARRPRPATPPTWPTWCGPRGRTSAP